MERYELRETYYAPTAQHNRDSLAVVLVNLAAIGFRPMSVFRLTRGMKHQPPHPLSTQHLTNVAFIRYLCEECRFLRKVA